MTGFSVVCNDTLPTGKYTCTVTGMAGFAVTDTAYVEVWPKPVFNPPFGGWWLVHVTDTLKLDAGSGYASYLWSTGDTTSSITYKGSDLANLFGSSFGAITVTVTSVHGCTGVGSVNIEVGFSVDDEDQLPIKIELMPNPAGESVLVISSEAIELVEIYAPAGQRLMHHNTGHHHEKALSLPLTGLSSGSYLVQVKTAKGSVVKRLVRE
jgi:hypothetical protein